MSDQAKFCDHSRTITSWWRITWGLTALALLSLVHLRESQAQAADRANTTKSGGLGVREVDGTVQFEPGLKGEMRPGFVLKQGAEPWDHKDRDYTQAAGFGANRKRVPPKAPFGEMTAEEVAALPDIQGIMEIAAHGPEAIAKLVTPQRGVDIECPVRQENQPPRGAGKKRLPLDGLEVKEMEGTETTEFAARVREAILEDGKLRSTILDLVCSCPNVVTQI